MDIEHAPGEYQAQDFAAALPAGGSEVKIKDFPETGGMGHAEKIKRYGDPAYAPTAVAVAWLKRILAR